MHQSHILAAASAWIVAVAISAPVNGATITWGAATNTTGISDISTTGGLLKAFNSGGTSTVVNGVTFAQYATAGDDVYTSFDTVFSPPGTNNIFDDLEDLGELDSLLSTANFLGTPNGNHTITLQGLNIGTQYQLQLFFMDQRGSVTSPPAGCVGCNDREVTFTSDGNSVTLEADPGNASTAPFGQFTLGSFTADAAIQEFLISGTDVQQVNAWQLREVVVPLPPSIWIFGAGVLGLLGMGIQKNTGSPRV